MDYQHILALIAFAFSSTVSPGPNNIMLMTSGANVGFMRTVPHMLGVIIGFSLMIILVGVGLMGIFVTYPFIHQLLQIICLVYLFYLAMKIMLNKSLNQNKHSYKPMGFWTAASFQWVNPKGWSMALTAISIYNTSTGWYGVLIISAVFAAVNIPSVAIWTVAGKQFQLLLKNPIRIKTFNYVMAGLLIVSTLPMIMR